ncbi:MAG TPA: hypothetical protein VE988_10265 [Gemmataceae bacterium]|nr:hypothetical protein [Gemmataceae bacterium]
MLGKDWTQRIRRPAVAKELFEMRAAARDLAQQGQHAPGKARLVFQTVADIALIGTAVISGALAAVHLWKALARSNRESHDAETPEAAGAGRSPPHGRGQHAVAHDASENEGHHARRVAGAGHGRAFDDAPETQR